MTITYWAWDGIEKRFREFISPDPASKDLCIPPELLHKQGVTLVCNDILAALRNTSVSHWIGTADGKLKHISCATFIRRVLKHAFETLQLPDVQKYIICIDPLGNSRPEKAATQKKRKKKVVEGAPEILTMPPGQSRFFCATADMPGPLDLIFQTPHAKAELYEFITEYLGSHDVSSLIPEGKWLILSGGGVRIERSSPEEKIVDFRPELVTTLPPIRYTRDKPPELLTNLSFPGLSEGDLDVWRWIDYFPEDNFHVHSKDGDVFLIGLLQMRKIIRVNPKRRGWFITQRSVGSEEPDPERLERKELLKAYQRQVYDRCYMETHDIDEAFRKSGGVVGKTMAASSSSSTGDGSETKKRPRKEPVFLDRYVDMVGIYHGFIEEVHELSSEYGIEFQNPIEVYVLGLCLSSDTHDYIQTKLISGGVGAQYIWNAFKNNLGALNDIVMVFKPHSDHPVPQMNLRHYVVDTEKLEVFVRCIYEEKASSTINISKTNNTSAKLAKARAKSSQEARKKKGPSSMQLQIVASQCAWLLQYWGNGIHADYNIVDATKLIDEESKLPLYAYVKGDWATQVVESRYKIAPPIEI